MSDHSAVDEVMSGAPYVVHAVNDRPPTGLDDFLSSPVVAVTVESRRKVVLIHGPTRRDGDSVVIYEKDNGGTGKDVRTWRVLERDGRFEVAERAIF